MYKYSPLKEVRCCVSDPGTVILPNVPAVGNRTKRSKIDQPRGFRSTIKALARREDSGRRCESGQMRATGQNGLKNRGGRLISPAGVAARVNRRANDGVWIAIQGCARWRQQGRRSTWFETGAPVDYRVDDTPSGLATFYICKRGIISDVASRSWRGKEEARGAADEDAQKMQR